MRKESIESFAGYIQQVELFDILSDTVVFRGQTKEGHLLPSVARKNPKLDTTPQEMKVVEQLRLMGASLFAEPNPNLLELLVIAQHSGLKTRLLDWTSNPLAALWFACANKVHSGDAFVYAMEADGFLAKDVYEKDPFQTSQTRVFQPRLTNERILAQHGWFTLHRYSTNNNAFVSLDVNPETAQRLTEIRVPGHIRGDILRSLDRHGINERTLFPDLGGLCHYLNWKHGLS